MDNPYSLIHIEDRLESLTRFTGSSGIIFYKGDQIYAFPAELERRLLQFTKPEGDIDLQKIIEAQQHTRIIKLQCGKLIFLDPSTPIEESTLRLLGDQLADEIHIASVFNNLCQASIAISSNLHLHTVLHIIMSLTEELLDNEVSAVMLLKPDKKELYWELSRGDKSEFFERKQTIQLGQGIAGDVALTGEAVLLNDVHEDLRWDDSFDHMTGFRTRSMICVPITLHGNILGVIEVINKKDGAFTTRDLKILEILSAHAGPAIENAKIHGELERAYEELELLDKAKERVINHLAHELKTPLALISGAFERISRLLKETPNKDMERALIRGKRNVNRLIDLQDKIHDILNQKSVEEKDKILSIIEDAVHFIEEHQEEGHQDNMALLNRISSRIESIFNEREIRLEKIRLEEILNEITSRVISSIAARDLSIQRDFEKDLSFTMDREIIGESFLGLLKNAVENTPDEGKIEVNAFLKDRGIRIGVRDYGIGITEENQKLIFGGFFHTQDSSLYASKKPYQFSAGGTGSDLLRIKSFSKRFGFSVDFTSRRCRFIPTDSHRCPGRISACPFIKERSECFSSGGSHFYLTFPHET